MADALLELQDEVRERPKGSNSDGGDSIDVWSARFGLRRVPWCALGLSTISEHCGYDFHTARAIDFVKQARAMGMRVYTQNDVLSGQVMVKKGWIIVKGRPGGNHVDVAAEDWTSGFIDDGLFGRGWVIGCNVNDGITLRWGVVQRTNRNSYTFFIDPDSGFQ